MRFVSLVFLVLFAAACDSGSDVDALVGAWRLDAVTETVRVTSQTAQALPDLSQDPLVSVSASGAYTAGFDVLLDLTGVGGDIFLRVATDEGGQTGAELDVAQIHESAQANLIDYDTNAQFSGFFGPATVLARTGSRFMVLPRTLTGIGEATIEGTVTFPEIILAPGVPTQVQPYEPQFDGTLTVTFEAGGGFSAQASADSDFVSATGTWERVDAERVRIITSDDGVIESGVFEIAEIGSALVLEGEDLDRELPCDADCIRTAEPEVFADPGSLSAVSFITTLRFRAGS